MTPVAAVLTPGMLAAEATNLTSAVSLRIRFFLPAPTAARKATTVLVLNSSAAILSTTIRLPLAALSDRALSRARRLTFLLMV